MIFTKRRSSKVIELVVVAAIGYIVFSIYREIAHGDVEPVERKDNLTLIESVASISNEMAESAQNNLKRTKLKLKHFSWYRTFERLVSRALDIAEAMSRIEKKISKDSNFKKYYLEAVDSLSSASGDMQSISENLPKDEWFSEGPPSPTAPNEITDPELRELYSSVYDEQAARHRMFIQSVQKKLDRDPWLTEAFFKTMEDWELRPLLEEYFQYSKRVQQTSTETAQSDEPNFSISQHPKGPRGKAPPGFASAPANIENGIHHRGGYNLDGRNKYRSHAAEIEWQVEAREIPYLTHFTRCENIASISLNGLCSVSEWATKRVHGIRNDLHRLDRRMDAISLSVSFPNCRMFYKYRQINIGADWAVLLISPEVLWRKSCGFFKFNAADSRMRGISREESMFTSSFMSMFENPEMQRESFLFPCDPTDPQAEVMVYESIEPPLIKAVAFETMQIAERWKYAAIGIETCLSGQDNGLFSSRERARRHGEPNRFSNLGPSLQ